MGPIERALWAQRPMVRPGGGILWNPALRFDALGCVFEAATRLGLTTLAELDQHLPDVLSEAIEAAEALGL